MRHPNNEINERLSRKEIMLDHFQTTNIECSGENMSSTLVEEYQIFDGTSKCH